MSINSSAALPLFQEQPASAMLGGSMSAAPGNSSSSSPRGTAASGGSAGSSLGHRPKAGKGSRGPRPRLFKKNTCQADGCAADLSGLPRYNLRNHICTSHKVADSFLRLGSEVRFCQRCGVAHPLKEFDGYKKSCRRQLAVHNNRRRKAAPPAEAGAAAAAQPAQPQQQAQLQQQLELLALGAAPALDPAAAAAAAAPAAPAAAGLAAGQPGAVPAALLLDGDLELGADWAAAGASLDASPEASVGSAALSEPGPGSWLLEDISSGGGGEGGGGGGMLWEPATDVAGPLGGELAGADVAQVAALPAGSPYGTPAHERVCCDADCGFCGACCAHGSALAPAPCPLAGTAAAAAAAGGTGGVGSAPVSSDAPTAGPSGRAQPPAEHAGPSAALGLGSTAAAAAAAAEAAAEAAAAHASPLHTRQVAAVAALDCVRQHNAAVYNLFVQQQLLAAQTLLATAGVVLSQRLPLARTASTCSVSSR